MKFPLSLLLLAACTIAVQRPAPARSPEAARQSVPDRELRALQDSIWRCAAACRGSNAAADALYASGIDGAAGCVEVRLLLADSATRALFRRTVHDSPLVRLEGFDPGATPYSPAPADTPPPAEISLRPEYALYPTDTERVRLSIHYRGDETLSFGTDYTLCRFQHGRWEVLPVCMVWNSLLLGLGRPEHPAPGSLAQEEYTYSFDAELMPSLFPARYGRYRVCKTVYLENPRRDYLLSADFILTPLVPFTRF